MVSTIEKKNMDLHLFSDSLSKNNTSLFFSKEKTDFLIQQIIYIYFTGMISFSF
jgi:hypothetical protein